MIQGQIQQIVRKVNLYQTDVAFIKEEIRVKF